MDEEDFLKQPEISSWEWHLQIMPGAYKRLGFHVHEAASKSSYCLLHYGHSCYIYPLAKATHSSTFISHSTHCVSSDLCNVHPWKWKETTQAGYREAAGCRALFLGPETRELLNLSLVLKCMASRRGPVSVALCLEWNVQSSVSKPPCHFCEPGSEPANCSCQITGLPSMVSGAAASRNWLDMQILGPNPSPTESEILEPGSSCLSFQSKPSG